MLTFIAHGASNLDTTPSPTPPLNQQHIQKPAFLTGARFHIAFSGFVILQLLLTFLVFIFKHWRYAEKKSKNSRSLDVLSQLQSNQFSKLG
jgi:hypothetical protein